MFPSILSLSATAFTLPTVPLAMPAGATSTLLAAASDPFADPVFNTHVTPIAEAAQHTEAATGGLTSGSMLTGFTCYIVGMIALTFWDEFILPKLQDRGLMPEMPSSLRSYRKMSLNEEQRAYPWITPVTADRAIGSLPPLEALMKEPVRVGSYGGVTQYIKAHAPTDIVPHPALKKRPIDGTPFDADEFRAVCKVSKEFSDYYGQTVYLCKRKSEFGKFEQVRFEDSFQA